jgi:glycosyltransferase involved in cell wall biosynthesis
LKLWGTAANSTRSLALLACDPYTVEIQNVVLHSLMAACSVIAVCRIDAVRLYSARHSDHPPGVGDFTLAHQKLTVIVAVKNHANLIGDCVRSVREVADEVLIADSGATDDTLAIARDLCAGSCECNVVARQYITACSFKNWAIAQASHPWVLILDVDERLSERLADEISKTLSDQPSCDGYYVRRHNYFMGHRVRFSGWGHDRVIRLFRRDQFRYPHEEADHGEFKTQGRTIGRLRKPMKHYARRSYAEQFEKCDRYSLLQAQRWYQQGRRPSFLQLLFRPPLRFLRSYIAYGGFLDGKVGVQLAHLTAYYAFMKQARLWELWHSTECERPSEESPQRKRNAA